MLILTRRPNESIVMTIAGQEVVVTILATKGNQVRVGVTAPKSVTVHREEVHQRIKDEQAAGKVAAC